jgi:hypothetical protein
MMRSRSLLLLVGPLALAASLGAPVEACWLGGGYGWGAGRAAYRPVYGYGYTSYYAPYSSYGYGGYAYGLGGCNSCSTGGCGVSYYGGYGMSSCCNPCNTCGGPCGYGGTCSNCAGGDCQLGAPAGPVTPDPAAAQPQAPYSDTGTTSGESHPTTRNPPPDSDLGTPRTIPEDDATGTSPRPSFRPATPPAEGTTPVTPPENTNPTPPANDTEGALGEPTSGASKDGAGFLDEVDSVPKLRAPVIKVDLDDKVAWQPTGTRARIGTRPSYQTARLVRIAAFPAPAAWVPTLAEIAKK